MKRKTMKRKTISKKIKEKRIKEKKRTSKKRTKKIKDKRMISKKKYKGLLQKKRLRKNEKKDLDNALFVNYCKCVKKIKYSRNYSKGSEYPICISSIYTKRNRDPPKGIIKRCSEFR